MLQHKLPPDLKANWLRELRSNRYHQISSHLRDEHHGRCCLGVYVDANHPEQEWQISYEYLGLPAADGLTCDILIPFKHLDHDTRRALAQNFTLDFYPDGDWPDDVSLPITVEQFLTTANDTLGWTFHEIADWIEQHL